MMEKTILLISTLTLLALSSCKNENSTSTVSKSDNSDSIQFIENGQEIPFVRGADSISLDKENETAITNFNLTLEEGADDELANSPDLSDIPPEYFGRKYLPNVSDPYSVQSYPGNLVLIDGNGKARIVSLKPVIKNSGVAITKLIGDEGVSFKHQLTYDKKGNATAMFGGIIATKESSYQLIVQDVATSFVPDSLIDEDMIDSAAKKKYGDTTDNVYYIRSVTLTTITSERCEKSSFSGKISATWVTAEGSTYKAQAQFVKKRLISMDLRPIGRIIKKQNNVQRESQIIRTENEGYSDSVMNAFKQGTVDLPTFRRFGGGGNCASVGVIKAAIATLGINNVFRNVEKNDQRRLYTITLRDSVVVHLTFDEMEFGKMSSAFGLFHNSEKNQEILDYAKFCFAVMCKVEQVNNAWGRYRRAVTRLNKGMNTTTIYALLGVNKIALTDLSIEALSKEENIVIYNNAHCVFSSRGIYDELFLRDAPNGTLPLAKFSTEHGGSKIYGAYRVY